MTQSMTCYIPAQPIQYDILIRSGILQEKIIIEKIKPLASRFVIITDDEVERSAGKLLYQFLQDAGLKTDLFTFAAGESSKTRETKQQLEDQMLQANCGRDTCLIALGGGVTTDLGGFIASTYNRGIPLVIIPTSLLAMVDASIGGKNGVDVPQGKNLIGTFYQPKHLFIDPSLLNTLPIRELRNGITEMIKHALIADANYFTFLQEHIHKLLSLTPEILERAIYTSCLIKKTIVEEDEKETGKRRLLNCGHTIAHAIELLSQFKISHGEAVAIGIIIEGYLSHQLGYLSMEELDKIIDLFKRYEIPLRSIKQFNPNAILEATLLDKKNLNGKSRYVLLEKIGKPFFFKENYCTTIDDGLLLNSLSWYTNAVCNN